MANEKRSGMIGKSETQTQQAQGAPGKSDDAYTQAGAPGRQDQLHSSLDTSESGRPRDEGPDAIERTTAQRPRRDPQATVPSDADPADRETL